MASSHIAVAGGGIAGLSAALALSQRGMSVTVFEQAPDLEEVGAGLQLSPNAWRALSSLGLEQALETASTEPEAVCIRTARDGRVVARMPLGAAARARWGAPYRIIHRADLQKILADAVGAQPSARLRLGARVAGFRRDGKQVAVTLEDGSEDGPFAGLVGADGLWSAVRAAALGDGPPRRAGKVAWRATVPGDALPPGFAAGETGLWLGRDAHLVHYALRGGAEVNIVAVIADEWDEHGWSAPGDAAQLAARFAGWPAPARALVAAARDWRRWALADRAPCARWGEGPVTLAGDAAHPLLPFLAQGAAMAVEDACVLAACLDGTDDVAAAMRTYERRRAPRVARAGRAARANGDIYHLGGLFALARDAALAVTGTERLMGRWDWLYGWRDGVTAQGPAREPAPRR